GLVEPPHAQRRKATRRNDDLEVMALPLHTTARNQGLSVWSTFQGPASASLGALTAGSRSPRRTVLATIMPASSAMASVPAAATAGLARTTTAREQNPRRSVLVAPRT